MFYVVSLTVQKSRGRFIRTGLQLMSCMCLWGPRHSMPAKIRYIVPICDHEASGVPPTMFNTVPYNPTTSRYSQQFLGPFSSTGYTADSPYNCLSTVKLAQTLNNRIHWSQQTHCSLLPRCTSVFHTSRTLMGFELDCFVSLKDTGEPSG
jgi:hypothetical protein